MSIPFADAAKAKQIRELFQRFGRIFIVVDSTAGDVEVPDFLKGDPTLRLILNVRMPQTIHIRDNEIVSDFSFSGAIHSCRIPMSRIWSAFPADADIEQGLSWDDAMPETIRILMQTSEALLEDGDAHSDTESIANAPALAAVPATDKPATGETEKPKAVDKAPFLRVVK